MICPLMIIFSVFILSCTHAFRLAPRRLRRPAFQIRHDSLTASPLTAAAFFFFSIFLSQPLMLVRCLIPLCLTAPPFPQNTDKSCQTKGRRVGGGVEPIRSGWQRKRKTRLSKPRSSVTALVRWQRRRHEASAVSHFGPNRCVSTICSPHSREFHAEAGRMAAAAAAALATSNRENQRVRR